MAVPEEESVSKLPLARVFQLPTELDHLWDGVDDIGLGLRWLSAVKKADIQVELGGPKWDYKMASIFYIEEDPEKVNDGEVKLIGPDVNEVKPGTSLPGLFTIRMYAKTLTQEHQGYVSRQIGCRTCMNKVRTYFFRWPIIKFRQDSDMSQDNCNGRTRHRPCNETNLP